MSGIADLLAAIRRGDAKGVADLLSASPDLAGARDGHTPLHEAAFNGDLPLIRVLLEHGADRSARTGEGESALDIAIKQGRHEAARLLGG